MDELRLRSRTVSEIVDAAFALYRRDSGQYILIMAIATIPQVVMRLLMPQTGALGLASILFMLATLLMSMLTYTIGTAAVTKYGAEVYLGEPADLDATVRSVIPKVGSLIWAGIMRSILYFLGALCFFVGFFYVAARFFAVSQVIVLEDKAVGEAFSRSSVLSAGRKRHVLNTLILVWIIYLVLSACVTLIANISKSTVVEIALASAFQIVAYPVISLTDMLLYYDCRIRGEGFDIERMAASLDLPGSSPGMAGATS